MNKILYTSGEFYYGLPGNWVKIANPELLPVQQYNEGNWFYTNKHADVLEDDMFSFPVELKVNIESEGCKNKCKAKITNCPFGSCLHPDKIAVLSKEDNSAHNTEGSEVSASTNYPDFKKLGHNEQTHGSIALPYTESTAMQMPEAQSNKSWPEDFNHENGKYINICTYCKGQFMGHKRRVICKECYTVNEKEENNEVCKFDPCKHPNCTECGNRSFVAIAGELNRVGIDTLWLILWGEVQNFYGDIKKTENQEAFLRRLQRNLTLIQKPELKEQRLLLASTAESKGTGDKIKNLQRPKNRDKRLRRKVRQRPGTLAGKGC